MALFAVGACRRRPLGDPVTSPLPSTEQEPLNVRVARALGWAEFDPPSEADPPRARYWIGRNPSGAIFRVPEYYIDWSATGPLVEKYGIGLVRYTQSVGTGEWMAFLNAGGWISECAVDIECHHSEFGPTPLTAVCNLLLKMGEAGRL